MKKGRIMRLVLVCILVVGIAVTCSTNHFIDKQEEENSLALEYSTQRETKEPQEENKETQEMSPATFAAKGRSAPVPQSGAPKTAQKEVAETISEAAAVPAAENDSTVVAAAAAQAGALISEDEELPAETIKSPLGDIDPDVENKTSSEIKNKSYFKKHLEELDVQIQKMRESETDSTTYSILNTFSKELKLWDNELNSIYTLIIDKMEEESAAILVNSEREWMKSRDSKAAEAAKKFSGGSMESIEYTASMTESTRARVYELLDLYGDMLE